MIFVAQRINLPPITIHEECRLVSFLLFWVHVQLVTFKTHPVSSICAVLGLHNDRPLGIALFVYLKGRYGVFVSWSIFSGRWDTFVELPLPCVCSPSRTHARTWCCSFFPFLPSTQCIFSSFLASHFPSSLWQVHFVLK